MASSEEEDLLVHSEDGSSDNHVDIEEETEYVAPQNDMDNRCPEAFLKMDICDEDDDADIRIIATRFPDIKQSRYSNTMTYIVLLVFLISSFITVVVFITLLVIPYARVAHFKGTMCNVTMTTEHVTEGLCSCEEECELLIPCLVINVIYADTTDGIAHKAMMYDNEMLLDLKVNIEFCYITTRIK